MSDINFPESVEPTYQPPVADKPTNTMAVISLISGILGLTVVPFLGSIIALVLGYMARKEIKESDGAQEGDGIAVAGLVMGWIGVGLGACACIAALALFLFVFSFAGIAFWETSLLLPLVVI